MGYFDDIPYAAKPAAESAPPAEATPTAAPQQKTGAGYFDDVPFAKQQPVNTQQSPPTNTALGIPFNEKQTAFTYGMGSGATAGFLPDIHSAVSSLTGGGEFGQIRDEDRAQLDAAYKAHPWLYDAGYVGGMGLLMNALGPLALTSKFAGAPYLERAAPAVIDAFGVGALYGTGESRAPTVGGRLEQGLKTGVEAAPFGPLFEAAAPIVGAIWGKVPHPGAQQAVDQANQLGITLDRGQATGDVATQRYIDESRSGLHGGWAENAVKAKDTKQAQEIANAGQQIQTSMSQPQTRYPGQIMLGTHQDVGDILPESVQNRVQDLTNAKNVLYQQAAASNSRIFSNQVPNLFSGIDNALAPSKPILDAMQAPITQSLRNYIEKAIVPNRSGVEVNDIERVRQILNSNAPARGTPDYRTYTLMKNAFDDWYDTAIQNGLKSGDPNVLNQIKGARSAVAELKGITRPAVGDDAGKIISKWADPNANVTPVEVANSLTGLTQIGAQGKSVRLAQRLNQMFGANSPEMDAVRQAVWLKATTAPLNKPNPGPQAVVNALDHLLDGNGKPLSQAIYTPNHLAQMRAFRDTLKRTIPNKGATNPPNSGSRAAAFLQKAWDNTMTALLAGTGHLPGAAMFKMVSPMFRSVPGLMKTNTLLYRPVPKVPNPNTARTASLARFSPIPAALTPAPQSGPSDNRSPFETQ